MVAILDFYFQVTDFKIETHYRSELLLQAVETDLFLDMKALMTYI